MTSSRSPSMARSPRASDSSPAPGRRTAQLGGGSRRRGVARRRRGIVIAGAVAVLVGALVAWPLLHQAVRTITLPLHHQDIIRQQARIKHLDPTLIAAVIYAESKFRDQQTSPTGALGLMQLEPATAVAIARRSRGIRFAVADLATPQVNIAYGSYYLRLLLDRYHGRETVAVAAYNGGESNVDRWVARSGGRLSVASIPFPETRAYVSRVLQAQSEYRSAYGPDLAG